MYHRHCCHCRWQHGGHLHLPQVRVAGSCGATRSAGGCWVGAGAAELHPPPVVLLITLCCSPGVISARRGTASISGRNSLGGSATPTHVSLWALSSTLQWGSDGGGGGGPRLSAGLSGALSISAGWGSNHDIRVVETNYDEYALVATQISKSTGSSNMVLLYSTSSRCPCAAQTPRLSSEGICPAGGGHGTAPPGRVPLPWLPGAALTLLFPQAAPRRLHPSAWRGSCSSPRSRA